MRRFLLIIGLLVPVFVLSGCGQQADRSLEPTDTRIVVLGGSVAETVVELGAADQLVARDDASVYPDTLRSWPSVGYFRAIGAEAVLSVNPTLILADPSSGPASALQQLESTGIQVVRLPGGATPEAIEQQILAIADVLGRSDRSQTLIDEMYRDLETASRVVDESGWTPRVLLALGQDGGSLNFAGSGTNADEFIRLAGARNVFEDAEGYKPMSAEAIIQAEPDVVLLLYRTVAAFGGVESIASRPEMRSIQPRFIVLPDEALGFGPSLGAFVLDFACRLHTLEDGESFEPCGITQSNEGETE